MTGSPVVVEFLALFARIRELCNDDPELLEAEAYSDAELQKLCNQLFSVASDLQRNERRRRELFAAPVNPTFVRAWRDYEERYENRVAFVWLSEVLPPREAVELASTSNHNSRWDTADEEGEEQSGGIEGAIEFAQFNADQDDRWIDQPAFIERIQDGLAAWERLKQDTGFDLRGVFRRRALIPFVLVPREVAASYGDTEKLSMLRHLQQAHDAFVYGAPYAAIALMRSIMEAVLRDHYGAEGNLEKRIQNARDRLPRGASEAALDRLRRRANAILHLDRKEGEGLPEMNEELLEKEIVSLLFVLRALIEGAKR